MPDSTSATARRNSSAPGWVVTGCPAGLRVCACGTGQEPSCHAVVAGGRRTRPEQDGYLAGQHCGPAHEAVPLGAVPADGVRTPCGLAVVLRERTVPTAVRTAPD